MSILPDLAVIGIFIVLLFLLMVMIFNLGFKLGQSRIIPEDRKVLKVNKSPFKKTRGDLDPILPEWEQDDKVSFKWR